MQIKNKIYINWADFSYTLILIFIIIFDNSQNGHAWRHANKTPHYAAERGLSI